MSNETVFGIQLAAWLTYVGIAFVLYRMLVTQKDAQIALLKDQLAQAESQRVEVVLKRLQDFRSTVATEIEEMEKNHSTTKEALEKKVAESEQLRQQISALEQVKHNVDAQRVPWERTSSFINSQFIGNSSRPRLPLGD
jgi:septal ring factor EnvC (AmiA/AmiB activator)